VREWLEKNAKENPMDVTIDRVIAGIFASKGIAVSKGGVCNTSAWKAFHGERMKESCAGPRTVRLSKSIKGSRPDDTEEDPLENVIQTDEDAKTFEEIMQMAESSTERDRLTKLSEDQRRQLIELRRQQRREEESDRQKDEARRERSRRS
jgi:hypothetical protein